MSKHTYQVWNSTSRVWVAYYSLPLSARREADRKGLVEHSPFCACNKPTDNPPF